MRFFVHRRIRNLVVCLLLALPLCAAAALLSISLVPVPFFSGWLLIALVVGLAAYNVRKRLPFLPLGNSATWLQLHVYGGLLSFVVFLIHLGGRWPNGVFETLLAAAYTLVFLSGLLGLVLSRVVPARLSTRGEEVIFERIPAFRRRLREEVETLILESTARTDTSAVPEFYLARLRPFFDRPRNFVFHLVHWGGPLQRLLLEIRSQERYLNAEERELMEQIADRVRVKDELDYQYSLQATLKYWLFLHVPLTWALLVFAVFHVALVWQFTGRLW